MVTLNIDMPTNCMNCPLLGKDSMYCQVYPRKDLNLIEVVNSKPKWCPIIADSAEGEYIKKEDVLNLKYTIYDENGEELEVVNAEYIHDLPSYSFPDREKGKENTNENRTN